jgi:hypothetical protein
MAVLGRLDLSMVLWVFLHQKKAAAQAGLSLLQ